jgi:hypothetical protein
MACRQLFLLCSLFGNCVLLQERMVYRIFITFIFYKKQRWLVRNLVVGDRLLLRGFGPYVIKFMNMYVCYNCCHDNTLKGFGALCLLSVCWSAMNCCFLILGFMWQSLSEDLSVDGRIILKLLLGNYYWRILIWLIWLGICNSSEMSVGWIVWSA